MKKRITKQRIMKQISLLIFISMIFSMVHIISFAAIEEETFTLMVYLNGTSLETENSYASKDLSEMLNATISDHMNVLIYTGGTEEWHSETMGLPNIKENQNQLWKMEDDELVLIKDYANLNMGSSTTLEGFITDSVELYPADKYGIVLWNHGGGPVWGFGQDDFHYNDSLTVVELNQAFQMAFKQTKMVFEFIGFDACLMNTLEVANALDSYGKVLIGSEEYTPATGWDYNHFLTEMSDLEHFDYKIIGEIIVNTYYDFAVKEDNEDSVTMSVVDMAGIDDLMVSFNSLFEKLSYDIGRNINTEEVMSARIFAESFGEYAYGSGGFDVVDLYDFVRRLESTYSEAEEVLRQIEDVVIYNLNGAENSRAAGLALYIPDTYFKYISHAINTYNSMSFSVPFQTFISVYTSTINRESALIETIASEKDPYKYPKKESLNDVYSVYTDEDSRKVGSNQIVEATNGHFQITIATEDLNDPYILSELGYKDEDDIVILGDKMIWPSYINNVEQTFETAISEDWVYLDGHLVTVSYYTGNIEAKLFTYYIPLYINDEYCNLFIEFDGKRGTYNILGYSQEFSSKQLTDLRKSDKIGTIFITYPLTRFGYEEYEVILKEEFTIWNLDITTKPINTKELVLHMLVGTQKNPSFESNFMVIDAEKVASFDNDLILDYYTSVGPSFPEVLPSEDTEDIEEVEVASSQSYYRFFESVEAYEEWRISDYVEPVIGATSWAYGYINTALYYQLLPESLDSRYQENITREEFCELVIKLMEHYGVIDVDKEENPFIDTTNTSIKKAYYLGIVDGYGDGRFGPNDLITREQLVTMFFRALCLLEEVDGLAIVDYVCEFDDLESVSPWARESVEYFAGFNIISGVGHGLFAPMDTATIEQSIKVLIETFAHYDINR